MDELKKLLETFSKSAFRLEGLPHYSVLEEDEAYTHFVTNGEVLPRYNQDWNALVSKNIDAGKSMKRLRLFSDPLSQYEEFEVLASKDAIVAGEEIRVMDRDDWPWTGDFWFFDATWIARMHYDADGVLVDVTITEANEDDKADLEYWMDIFNSAPLLSSLYKVD